MPRSLIDTARTTAGNRFKLFPTEKGLLLNGSSDYLTCPVDPETTGFSVGFWLLRLNVATSTTIVSYKTDATTDGFQIVRNSLNRLVAQIYNDTSVTVSTSNNQGGFAVGNYHHFVFTFAPNDAKLYLDGVLTVSDVVNSMSDAVSQTLTIGKNSYAASGYFAGIIKDFVFQNTATPWTQDQIDDLYYLREIPSGTDVWYKFDDDVADSSGNSNDGTLTGGTYSTVVPSQFTSRGTG